ncbi:ABC transporter ATP-binding protein [Pseudonocardia acidicola]|uniref:ABC transporter ATP-binding protein n=1 Tax=Pseudonocardia acidicola TaxID=2724939 RepID=A0ABX1SEA6_9PSEU|nr:ABC transporter ATP-binding protein [Pseudonocardia acidicola]NMH99875.1 ABC transporter ATP-binding protein [Pseudonocardia acidicola]
MTAATHVQPTPPATGPEPILQVTGLTRRFGGLTAVDHVDLTVRPDTVRAVIGPNGAGKTTLLDLITGFTRPDEGSVTFLGQDVLALAPHRLPGIGLMRTFQSARLVPRLSARENVMLGAHHLTRSGFLADGLRLPRSRREQRALAERADAVLDFLELRRFAATPGSDLPTGVQRLLEVGRALAGAPKLLLLDEPAAGLDGTETRELAAVLRAVSRAGTAIVLIEHDVEMVMSISDDVLVLDAGAVVADGPPAAVRADPAVLAAYLGQPDERGQEDS